jgi:imidazole glycerol-phosphate synthase subunit HisH
MKVMKMNEKVGILNLNLGNVNSIKRMIEKCGGSAEELKNPEDIHRFTKIILPGVGHFDRGMNLYNKSGFSKVLPIWISNLNNKLLGICLGMHLLCRDSEEGSSNGLNLVNASVVRIASELSGGNRLKVPHMGWNNVKIIKPNLILGNSNGENKFYFVHSYKVVPDDESITIGATEYGDTFCSAFNYLNIYGVQFHPEKSHTYGMSMFKNFLEL